METVEQYNIEKLSSLIEKEIGTYSTQLTKSVAIKAAKAAVKYFTEIENLPIAMCTHSGEPIFIDSEYFNAGEDALVLAKYKDEIIDPHS